MYYYKQVANEEIVSVEAKTKEATSPGFIEATKAEYDAFIAALPEPEPEPPSPDYLRACELLAQSPPAITMPDVWELLRIIGRRLGYRFEE